MKNIVLILLGYFLHILVEDLGNLSYEIRWINCVEKMHTGENPKSAPNGQHYCLHSINHTNFEKFSKFNFGLWAVYEEKIGLPRLKRAYERSKKE